MPCSSSQSDPRELDKVTRLLCMVCMTLEVWGEDIDNISPDLNTWWKEHRSFDEWMRQRGW